MWNLPAVTAVSAVCKYKSPLKGNMVMKTRIISGVVGAVLLLAVLFCPWTWVFAVVAALLAALAVWELLHHTGAVPGKLLPVAGMVFAAAEVLAVYRYVLPGTEAMHEVRFTDWLPAVLLTAFLLFVAVWWLVKRIHWKTVGYTVLATLYATVGFGSLAALRVASEQGWWNVLLLLVIAFMSDTGAYFVGTFLGKHKMAPVISPKKSWEGFFGGWAISVACTALASVIYYTVIDQDGYGIAVAIYAVIAAVLAPLSVCGDLLASLIKRHYGIKDYGNLMPGHGGVMDRFDSVVAVAPILFLLLMYFYHIAAYLFN